MSTRPTSPSKILQLQIERLVHRGLGMARIEGKAVFIPAVIPGEFVRIEIEEDRTSYATAKAIEIINPSPFRIQPACPYFLDCGGCQLAHISYEQQLVLKKEVCKETLVRLARFDPGSAMSEPLPSPSAFNYRSRARFLVQRGKLGFRAWQTQTLVQVADCLLLKDELRHALPALQELIAQFPGQKDFEVEMDLDPDSGEIHALVLARKKIFYRYDNGLFRMIEPPQKTMLRLLSFTQANPGQNEKMVELVSALAANSRAAACLELFAGAGNFSFALAKKMNRIVAVEQNQNAVSLAKLVAKEKQTENVEFVARTAESYLNQALQHKSRFELVLLDPPRAGAKKESAQIMRLKPKSIIYVSCEPSTLARDLKFLADAGYRLEKLIPIDLFPQTFHLESISLLTRAA
jgi:23S rRNA (uracil1939-C5)-methyltransferase